MKGPWEVEVSWKLTSKERWNLCGPMTKKEALAHIMDKIKTVNGSYLQVKIKPVSSGDKQA